MPNKTETKSEPRSGSLHGAVGCRRLAEEIAADLFRNGDGDEAQRLVLELENGRNGGGWCRVAVIDRVEMILKAANPTIRNQAHE